MIYTPIEDDWIIAHVPDLPGAVTQGRALNEAREMIQEAVELLLLSFRENAAKDAPGPRNIKRRSGMPSPQTPDLEIGGFSRLILFSQLCLAILVAYAASAFAGRRARIA